MSTRLRAQRPGHGSVDPWDPATNPVPRAAAPRWLLPLCFALAAVAVAAAV